MDAQQQVELIEECWRQIEEATLTGRITLKNGEVVELGTRRANDLLRLAENMVKRAPKRVKRMYTVEDHNLAQTESE